jgi:hypothetical protein
VSTLDTQDLDDRQLRLLDVLTEEFEDAALLHDSSRARLFHRLRKHLVAEGAAEGDFEFLTGQLARLVFESGSPWTLRQKTAQLKLISEMFALRSFHLEIDRGAVVSLAFADPPTRH